MLLNNPKIQQYSLNQIIVFMSIIWCLLNSVGRFDEETIQIQLFSSLVSR